MPLQSLANARAATKKSSTNGDTAIMPSSKNAEASNKTDLGVGPEANNNYILDIAVVRGDERWKTTPAPRPNDERRCNDAELGTKNDENYTRDEMTMLLIIAHKLDPKEARDYSGLSKKLTKAFGREMTYKSVQNKLWVLEKTWPEEVARVKALSPMHRSVQNTDRFLKLGLPLWMPYLLPQKQDKRVKHKAGEVPKARHGKKIKNEPDIDRVKTGRVAKVSPRLTPKARGIKDKNIFLRR
ncbi:uncharacterized protein K452DRAFT_137443 [Aplosporella prunicola CBS 121167]|uniref:Uncharacterized protein n=1 Tax=Aplosporella prunicola CBS 121167 TaxID=1176127 RepID=A0A6A6BRS5_9PEZI|nr:uncharacterized protein K452DRAFT_137443 [Aplosporella prunicola CBS 121167]KAF2145281.1 hypothetical protein K452DRAFT_137443 [Aplosporella prunicola CBS 121167]